jgi:hypothetical protein
MAVSPSPAPAEQVTPPPPRRIPPPPGPSPRIAIGVYLRSILLKSRVHPPTGNIDRGHSCLRKMRDWCPGRHCLLRIQHEQFTVRRQSSLRTSLTMSVAFTAPLNNLAVLRNTDSGMFVCF